MEYVLENREFTIGPFSPEEVARAHAEFLENVRICDQEHEENKTMYQQLGLGVPSKRHATVPQTIAEKKLEVITSVVGLIDLHINKTVGADGTPYTPKFKMTSIFTVLEEALVNAIIHGAQYDAAKQIKVYVRVWEDVVGTWRKIHAVMQIIDPGLGFDISMVPDPTQAANIEKLTGRGLAIIAKLVQAEFHGNQVVLSQSWEQDCDPSKREEKTA